MQIAGSSAIVVGGAGGLGEATVRRLHDAGAKVVVADLADDKGKALESELGVRYVPTDATSEESVNAAIAEAVSLAPLRISVDTHGGPASGGRLIGKDGSPLDLDGFKKTIEFYLTAVFNVMRLSAAAIAKSEPLEEGARGAIVNTASIAGYEGQIGQLPYSAAKGGVLGMTLVAARDLSPLGIRVNTIAPGTINTPAYGKAGRPARAVLGSAGAVPEADGSVDRVRAAGAEHHRERLPQRRDHSPRRSASLPAEVTLSGKVAFVAGASRGIGATVAAALAAEGAAVAVAARSEETGKLPGTIHSVAEGISSSGGRALAVPCDVTKEDSVEAAVAATVAEFGGIDILVANAGVLWLGPIESTPLQALAAVPRRQPDRRLPRHQGGHSACAGARRRVADRHHDHRRHDGRIQRLLGVQGRRRAPVHRTGRRPEARQHRGQLPEPVAGGADRGLAGGRGRDGDSGGDDRAAGGHGQCRCPSGPPGCRRSHRAPSSARRRCPSDRENAATGG